MTITLVQDASAGLPTSTTLTPNLASAITEGNLIVANCIAKNFASLTSPSGYTTAIEIVNSTEEDLGRMAYKVAGASEADPTWTQGGADHIAASTSEWNHDVGWVGDPLDEIAQTGRTSGTSVSSGTTAALSQNEALAVAALFARATAVSGDFVTPPSVDNGFTNLNFEPSSAGSGSACQIVDAYKIVSDGAAQTTTFSWTGTTVVLAGIAAFVASGGAPSSELLTKMMQYYHG